MSDETSLPFRIADGVVHARLDLRVYRLVAVQKAGYRLADRCTVAIGAIEGDQCPITLTFDRAHDDQAATTVAQLFFRELLDQELREKVSDETRDLRSLIIAHAYSKTGLIRGE